MYQKDFVLFMIEQFARIVAVILARITDGKFEEARLLMEQVYRQHLGLNSDLIQRLSHHTLLDLQRIHVEQYDDRCVVLAALLRMESKLALETGRREEAFAFLAQALRVLGDRAPGEGRPRDRGGDEQWQAIGQDLRANFGAPENWPQPDLAALLN